MLFDHKTAFNSGVFHRVVFLNRNTNCEDEEMKKKPRILKIDHYWDLVLFF